MAKRVKRRSVWWIVLLLAVVGWAAYRTGMSVWGNYELRKAQRAIAAHDWPQAHRSLVCCFWVWPDQPGVHLWAARTARFEGRVEDARRHLDRCAGDRVLAESARHERQLLAVHSGDLQDAQQLRGLLHDHPDDPQSPAIAEALIAGSLAAGEHGLALSVLDWWDLHRTSTSDRVVGLLWRAEIPVALDRYEDARTLCRQALDLDPAHWSARLLLVQLLAHDDPAEAQTHLTILLGREPDDPYLLIQQALVHRNFGRSQEARACLDRVLGQRPEWVEAVVERGLVELDVQQPDAAAPWLDRAEELAPHGRTVLLARIEYLRQKGQTAAVHQMQRELKLIEAQASGGREPTESQP